MGDAVIQFRRTGRMNGLKVTVVSPSVVEIYVSTVIQIYTVFFFKSIRCCSSGNFMANVLVTCSATNKLTVDR